MANTVSVAVTFTLDSSAANAPYNITNCTGVITFDDGTQRPWSGWVAEEIGQPEPNGATFTINVVDSSYAVNQTSIQNWALTFLPRGETPQASPFGNNANTVTGNSGTNQIGNFGLDLSGLKIKNAGDWDWSLMVQIGFQSGDIHCFASDPEMDVDG
jgi:hypothetical protein